MSERHNTDPTYDDIATLAYDRYVARGRADGSDLEDWLAAENDVRLRHTGIAKDILTASLVPKAAAAPGKETSRRRASDGNGSRGVPRGSQVTM